MLGALGFSQTTDKVGINTESPSQTLDVEGTMRVSTLGAPKTDAHLIGWDESNQQIVDMGEYSNMKFFQKKHFEIPVSNEGTQYHGVIGVDFYNLGIDATKFSLIISEPRLVYDNDDTKVAYIKTVSVSDKDGLGPLGGALYNVNDDGWLNRISNIRTATNRGFLGSADRWHCFQGTLVKTSSMATSPRQRNPLLYEIPKVLIYKAAGSWYFTGKYYYSDPANVGHTNFKWVFDGLILSNAWVDYTDTVEMEVSNDSTDGTPHVVTVTKGKYPVVN